MIKTSTLPVSRLEKLHYNWLESLKSELINSHRLPFSINGLSSRNLYVITPIMENSLEPEQERLFFESVKTLFLENNVSVYIVSEAKLDTIRNTYGIMCYTATSENAVATFTPYFIDPKTKDFKFGSNINFQYDEVPFKGLLNENGKLLMSEADAEIILKQNHNFRSTDLTNSSH